ncbi:MAG TPA: hypothetical protein VG457_04825 [Planctomycetota bacterium]|jgi:hypothetical protein|nr:hypothetical protein [Planctomycetota bacterium]
MRFFSSPHFPWAIFTSTIAAISLGPIALRSIAMGRPLGRFRFFGDFVGRSFGSRLGRAAEWCLEIEVRTEIVVRGRGCALGAGRTPCV